MLTHIQRCTKHIKGLVFGVSFVTSGYILYTNYGEFNSYRRFLRTFYVGTLNALDYKWSTFGYEEKSDLYNNAISTCHQRCATRILNGCLANGGLYIKLGQGLASFNHILPKQYIVTLEQLYDKAKPDSYDKVRQVFIEDLGKEPNEIFESFDEIPFAAASLAQVHKSRSRSGEILAVKVQYHNLRSRFHADIRTIELLLYLVEIIHPSFGFSWVLQNMKETLAEELDFEIEASNAERCARDLSHFRDIHIPKVHSDLSSKRILTAEYIDGIKINEVIKLRKAGVSLLWLDKLLVKAFSHQLFKTGFVHADPHPGNILVRCKNDGRNELVILDHGLYEYMPSKERYNLCCLTKSLIKGDNNKAQYYSNLLGVEDWETLGEIVLQHPINSSLVNKDLILLTSKLSDNDIDYMKRKALDHFDKIMAVLRKLPKPMLLFIRNLNTIRSVCRLHGDAVNRFIYMTDIAIRSSQENDSRNRFLAMFRLYMELLNFSLKLRFMQIKEYLWRVTLSVFNYIGNGPSLTMMEEIYEDNIALIKI